MPQCPRCRKIYGQFNEKRCPTCAISGIQSEKVYAQDVGQYKDVLIGYFTRNANADPDEDADAWHWTFNPNVCIDHCLFTAGELRRISNELAKKNMELRVEK